MKQLFFCLAAFSLMVTIGCRKIEMDGEKEIIIVPGGGGGTGQTITVQGRINADTTFRKGNTYILKGLVYMFVEYLSQSKIWEQSVVFIVEDDAQNGPDHVDAHRSTAYVAGGYVKRGFVDHTMYSTSSMLRTMELILGIPPMSQYDAAATPMWKCFMTKPDLTTFNSLPANIDLKEKTTRSTASAKLSEQFDFSGEDRIPDLIFSQVIWKAVKGEHSIMPAPRRSAFLATHREMEEDD